MTVFVDGNNVIGTTADGWWRDRPAAARRLVARLQCLAITAPQPIVLVLDVPQPDLNEGEHDGVAVRYPSRRGRNAADQRILELLDEGDEVITSDRDLAAAALQQGATVVGARIFLSRLTEAGC